MARDEDSFDLWTWLMEDPQGSASVRRRRTSAADEPPPGRRASPLAPAEALAIYRSMARLRGGALLSRTYVGRRKPMRWRCAEGHEWTATVASVSRGAWCRSCGRRRAEEPTRARTLARVQALARERGGECLSTEYKVGRTRLRFRCAKGHEWEALPSAITWGTWCDRCAVRGPRRATIRDMRALAEKRGGECLSRSYRGATEPLKWRCAAGHEWSAPPKSVRRGTWCSRCDPGLRKTLADVQAMAAALGGECLSPVYTGVLKKHQFRCQLGHVFKLLPSALQQGQWCSRCRKTPPLDTERLRLAAARHGGELLAIARDGPRVDRVHLACRAGHRFWASPQHLLAGTWCRECYLAARKGKSHPQLSILDMQELAASRGGECLSEFYANNYTRLRWRCNAGHEWDALPSQVRQRTWCPICSKARPGSIEGMRVIAAEHGGQCLSREYLGVQDRLEFCCARGHRFTTTGAAVKTGVWCPTCDPRFARAAAALAPRELPRRRRPPPAVA